MKDLFLPGLPAELIIAAYSAASGNEIENGKFHSPESSAALVANAFGFFLDRPADLPSLPPFEEHLWRPECVQLEATVRFPWSGGRHPCLDVLIETDHTLIGIESKRYEPFRSKAKPELSEAHWRPVWGEAMTGFESVRDGLHDGRLSFVHLDAAQFVKHAVGLRAAVHRDDGRRGKRPLLYYLFAQPAAWSNGSTIPAGAHQAQWSEVLGFAELMAGDEVGFYACSYVELLSAWEVSGQTQVQQHAAVVRDRFKV